MALTGRHPLYVVGHDSVVGRRGGRLVVSRDGVALTSAPLGRLSEVVVFGNATVTTPAMAALLSEDVPLVLLTADGRVRGRLEPPGATHVEVRRRQLDRHGDPAARLALARTLVQGKIHNQDMLLRRRAARAAHGDEVWDLSHRLAALRDRAGEASTLGELNGVEGAAAGAYFRGIRLLLSPKAGFRRRERSDGDIVNVLINYCSALLREVVLGAVVAAGLDPYVPFLHTPRPGRPTLVFDLMEEWRPVLLESTVLALLGLRTVRPDHLSAPNGADMALSEPAGRPPPRLAPEAAADVIHRFRSRLDSPARGWPQPGGRSYAAQIRAQSLALRAWVADGEPYLPFGWR
jgi:CRISPR-associated protein Cas1